MPPRGKRLPYLLPGLLLALSIGLALPVPAQAGPARNAGPADGKLGEWHLDLAASHLSGSRPVEDVRIYRALADGRVQSEHRTTGADGRTALTTYAARDDGRDYPMVDDAGHRLGTIALWRVDTLTQTFITSRDGAVTARGTTRLSADGQDLRMDIVPERKGVAGEPVVTLFHRAPAAPAR